MNPPSTGARENRGSPVRICEVHDALPNPSLGTTSASRYRCTPRAQRPRRASRQLHHARLYVLRKHTTSAIRVCQVRQDVCAALCTCVQPCVKHCRGPRCAYRTLTSSAVCVSIRTSQGVVDDDLIVTAAHAVPALRVHAQTRGGGYSKVFTAHLFANSAHPAFHIKHALTIS